MWRVCTKSERATAQGVSDITGVDYRLLKGWCDRDIVVVNNHKRLEKGRGKTRLFSVIDIVAIAYAFHWRQLGYAPNVAKVLVESITRFTEEKLLAEFDAGRSCLIPFTSALVERHSEDMAKFDLRPFYDLVKSKFRELS